MDIDNQTFANSCSGSSLGVGPKLRGVSGGVRPISDGGSERWAATKRSPAQFLDHLFCEFERRALTCSTVSKMAFATAGSFNTLR